MSILVTTTAIGICSCIEKWGAMDQQWHKERPASKASFQAPENIHVHMRLPGSQTQLYASATKGWRETKKKKYLQRTGNADVLLGHPLHAHVSPYYEQAEVGHQAYSHKAWRLTGRTHPRNGSGSRQGQVSAQEAFSSRMVANACENTRASSTLEDSEPLVSSGGR